MSLKTNLELAMKLTLPVLEVAVCNPRATEEELIQLSQTLLAFQEKVLPLYSKGILIGLEGIEKAQPDEMVKLGHFYLKMDRLEQSIQARLADLRAESVCWLFR